MITVTLLKKGGRLAGFEACGHAGYADEGFDIVCSAVSALTQTAVMGLKKRCNVCADTGESMYCVLDKGCGDREMADAEIILDTMFLGLRDIAENYKDYLSIIEREV